MWSAPIGGQYYTLSEQVTICTFHQNNGGHGFTALLLTPINEENSDLKCHQDRIHDMMSIVDMDADILHFVKT